MSPNKNPLPNLAELWSGRFCRASLALSSGIYNFARCFHFHALEGQNVHLLLFSERYSSYFRTFHRKNSINQSETFNSERIRLLE